MHGIPHQVRFPLEDGTVRIGLHLLDKDAEEFRLRVTT